MATILQLEDITSGYEGSEILHGVSLQVEEGKIVSILGPNGAGKTTLLRTIFGLIKPYHGKVSFIGKNITGMSPAKVLRSQLAYVPQGRSLHPWMSVEDNIIMGAYVAKDRKAEGERLQYVLSLFPQLRERRKEEAGVLSGGERQMLAIGRALMLAPRLILLDEPSLGLDPKSLQVVYERIQELNKAGTTIMLVEQNAKKAAEISSFIYILESGRITMSGRPEEIVSEKSIIEAYLGSDVKTNQVAP